MSLPEPSPPWFAAPSTPKLKLTTVGGDVLVAVVTANSVQALGLAVLSSAVAYVKAPLVMLLTGGEGVRFSARNQLASVVSALTRGAVNESEVALTLPGGTVVYAVVTNDAIKELDLREGAPATALIKGQPCGAGRAGLTRRTHRRIPRKRKSRSHPPRGTVVISPTPMP